MSAEYCGIPPRNTAGPPDVFPRGPEDVRDPYHVASSEALGEQDAALAGKRGGLLWAVSAASGEKLAEYELEAMPVFDGMAAADGRLYIALQGGRIVCMGKE